jgi:hypothetical protein
LIEWDTDIPELDVLLAEAGKARALAKNTGWKSASVFRHAGIPVAPATTTHHEQLQSNFATALFNASTEAAILPHLTGTSEHLSLYRGNLTATWDKVLSSAFPVIRQLVGTEFFTDLSRAFGKVHPSDHPDLNHFGGHFATFLSRFEHVADFPYLPDMARLEWSLHRAHYAPDAAAVDAQAIAALSPEDFELARFTLHPAASLLQSAWAVVPLWQAHQPGDTAFPSDMAVPSAAAIARPRFKTELAPLSPAACAALSLLAEGATMGEALDAAFELDDTFDIAANLRQWLDLGLLAPATTTEEQT